MLYWPPGPTVQWQPVVIMVMPNGEILVDFYTFFLFGAAERLFVQ